MGTYIALLRGINVGGRHKLPMRELSRIFAECGAAEVQTYIQSGNVIFEASAQVARALPARVAEAIESEFGFAVPVVLRTPKALREALAADPFAEAEGPDKLKMVAFLDRKPTAAKARALEPDRFLPDRFELVGSEIYAHYPNGSARSKLTTAYFDRRLERVSTARNRNTIRKLIELCEAR